VKGGICDGNSRVYFPLQRWMLQDLDWMYGMFAATKSPAELEIDVNSMLVEVSPLV